MFLFKHINTTAFLISSVLPFLIGGQDNSKSFTVHQVRSRQFQKSGPAALLSTYHKFNKRAPKNVERAAAANDGVLIVTPSEYDRRFKVPITIGGQTLNLEVDTGSDSFWTLSSQLEHLFPSTYDSSASNTSRLQKGQTFSTCYVDQSCVYNIKSHLSAPLFTADLEKGKPGSFDFGFINDSRHTGNIAYVPVDTNLGYWGFTVNGYAIGTDEFKSIPIKVVADTGSSLNSLPKTIVDAYYAGVSGAAYTAIHEGYTFPCGSTLPNITFNIGNYNAVVPGYFMNYSTYSFKNTTCYGGIQAAGDSGPFVLGDVFIKSQFVVFDASQNPRIGFAAKPL